MVSSEYHRKQAEILAGLALTEPDQTKATRLSLLALEHRTLADKLVADKLVADELEASQSPLRSPASNAADNHDPA
jgi:hypothetical protein